MILVRSNEEIKSLALVGLSNGLQIPAIEYWLMELSMKDNSPLASWLNGKRLIKN